MRLLLLSLFCSSPCLADEHDETIVMHFGDSNSGDNPYCITDIWPQVWPYHR